MTIKTVTKLMTIAAETGKRMTMAGKTAMPPVRQARVRVKLQRVAAQVFKAYPPDGESKEWWGRLQKALGTTSSAFVNASLFQLQRAAQLPGIGVCESAMNAALAMIEAAKPKDEIEAALAVQMAATHCAAMAVLARMEAAFGSERRVASFGTAAARLLRAFATQVETLRRLRSGGSQHVRVEHVHISEGSQAVVGIVNGSKGVSSDPSR